MLKLLETRKDSVESAFDSALVRFEHFHRRVGGYRSSRVGCDSHLTVATGRDGMRATESIYDLLPGLNREIGESGTGVFRIVGDARARSGRKDTLKLRGRRSSPVAIHFVSLASETGRKLADLKPH